MVERGLLGNKTKAGFYKKQKGEGGKRDIWTLDTATLDYRPSEKVKLPSLDMAKNIEDAAGANQGADLGQGSRRRVSLEDTVAHARLRRQTYSGDRRQRRRSRPRDALGLRLGVGAV